MRTTYAQNHNLAKQNTKTPIAIKRGILFAAKYYFMRNTSFRSSRNYGSRRAYSYYLRHQ